MIAQNTDNISQSLQFENTAPLGYLFGLKKKIKIFEDMSRYSQKFGVVVEIILILSDITDKF